MTKKYSNCKYELVYLKETTRGQVETVLHTKHLIRPNNVLIIYNIDTHFISTRLKSKILTMKNRNIDGLLGCFESDNDNLSYIELDGKGFVKKVKEKEKISQNASTGLYVFSDAEQFFQAGEEMIKKNIKVKDEFYVSEIYNILLETGGIFEIDIADEFIPLGTPDDIKKIEV